MARRGHPHRGANRGPAILWRTGAGRSQGPSGPARAMLSVLPPPALLIILAALALTGCESPAERAHRNSVRARIERSSAALPSQAAAHGLSAASYLIGKVTVKAQVTGAPAFRVEARRGSIAAFPCVDCHTKPVEKLRAGQGRRAAHWSIELAHAPPTTLKCATCHNAEAGMGALRLLDGSRVGFDHSYRLCGQCHSLQARDWAGGAHGKRLEGWAGPRVVRNCTGCHNPHDPPGPVVAPRWPAIVPNAPPKLAQEGASH